MTKLESLDDRLLGFRREFDETFAVAATSTTGSFEDLLAVRVGGDPYALRTREIRGLVASGKIVPVPSRRSELLGIAGVRGNLIAVYSLATLLGYPPDSRSTRWLAIVESSESLALGFEEFEGFMRVRADEIHSGDSYDPTGHHFGDVVRVGKIARRIADLRTKLNALTVPAGSGSPPKE